MPPLLCEPYWTTTDNETVRLYQGDSARVLARLPAGSVHTVVTSPPYWGLRVYLPDGHEHKQYELGSEPSPDCGTKGQAQCGRCFVCNLVAVFRAVRRVLREDGTCWINLGDSYSGGKTGREDLAGHKGSFGGRNIVPVESGDKFSGSTFSQRKAEGIPSGNLVGIPWRVALALQADGWILRQEIIWHKPSPMPESVKTRCTKAHEQIFLFTKSTDYYYDAEAVKEKSFNRESLEGRRPRNPDKFVKAGVKSEYREGFSKIEEGKTYPVSNKRSVWAVDDEQALFSWLAANAPDALTAFLRDTGNKTDVWKISSQGYPGAHFATFPPKLVEPCVLAGTSAHGCCAECGAPWRRVTVEKQLKRERPNDYVKRTGEEGTGNSCANTVAGVEVKTVGWEPTCECNGKLEKRNTIKLVAVTGVGEHEKKSQTVNSRERSTLRAPLGYEEKESIEIVYVSDLSLDDHPVTPCTVLDPFIGSGTTACVALALGQHSIGIDLSREYLEKNAVSRVEGALLSRRMHHLIPRKK